MISATELATTRHHLSSVETYLNECTRAQTKGIIVFQPTQCFVRDWFHFILVPIFDDRLIQRGARLLHQLLHDGHGIMQVGKAVSPLDPLQLHDQSPFLMGCINQEVFSLVDNLILLDGRLEQNRTPASRRQGTNIVVRPRGAEVDYVGDVSDTLREYFSNFRIVRSVGIQKVIEVRSPVPVLEEHHGKESANSNQLDWSRVPHGLGRTEAVADEAVQECENYTCKLTRAATSPGRRQWRTYIRTENELGKVEAVFQT
jgi:hypothetical protein